MMPPLAWPNCPSLYHHPQSSWLLTIMKSKMIMMNKHQPHTVLRWQSYFMIKAWPPCLTKCTISRRRWLHRWKSLCLKHHATMTILVMIKTCPLCLTKSTISRRVHVYSFQRGWSSCISQCHRGSRMWVSLQSSSSSSPLSLSSSPSESSPL